MYRNKLAYNFITYPDRTEKPRETGITMFIDMVLPLNFQKDWLASGIADYLDYAKTGMGYPGLLTPAQITEKIKIYHDHGVKVFSGGDFAEAAISQKKFDQYCQETKKLGYDAIEISDGLIDISAEEKFNYIRRAIDEHGLAVMGEVGKKEYDFTDEEFYHATKLCYDAGCVMIVLEGLDLFIDFDGNKFREELMERLIKNFGEDKLIFELPTTISPGITKEYKHKLIHWTVAKFGANVNLGNIEWEEIMVVEMTRVGTQSTTSFKGGAYYLT